jgi:enoyl-CoA hydratase/carnithine racemase
MTTTTSPRPPEGDWLGTPYLRFERKDGYALLTIDRPHKCNALTGAMYFGFRYAIQLVEKDPTLGGLLITGTGDYFAPGGDLGKDPEDWWTDFNLLGTDVTPFRAVRESSKPIVCAVNGVAHGGGMQIAMLADVSVASEKATFRAPELLRGIADVWYGQILPRQVGPARARDIMITGRTLTAAEATDWGVVARMVPHERLMEEAIEVLKACIRSAPNARQEVKRVMDDFYGNPRTAEFNASCFSEEMAEGFRAFKERRSPSWVPEGLRVEGRL